MNINYNSSVHNTNNKRIAEIHCGKGGGLSQRRAADGAPAGGGCGREREAE